MYVVEKILDHREDVRKKKNKMSFLIKWKGYNEPTWESETKMRETINDDVETYLKTNKVVKKAKSKRGKVFFEKVTKCMKNHNVSTNFKQTIDNWEVADVPCEGKCGLNFGDKKCGKKNPAYICDGRIQHGCRIVYCTKCFCSQLLENGKRRARNNINNVQNEVPVARNSLRRKNTNEHLVTRYL